METIFLVCGAGGPQLKRNPLGGRAFLVSLGPKGYSRKARAAVLNRVSFQSARSLQAAYEWFVARVEHYRAQAHQMLTLLPDLEGMCQDIPVWGLTSHVNLWLLPADDKNAAWLVVIRPCGPDGFRIGYTPLEAKSYGELVEAPAATVDQALVLIREAMIRSGGWGNAPSPSSAA